MRLSHVANPLHRIEQWAGQYFRPAALWEVGVYLVIPHSDGSSICESLKAQMTFLDSMQGRADAFNASHVPEAVNNIEDGEAHLNKMPHAHATSVSGAGGNDRQFDEILQSASNFESLIWDEEDVDELI